MKKHSILATAVLFSTLLYCCIGLSAGEERKSDVDNILSGFPGYHLLTLKELDSDARAFFTRHFPKADPSVLRADFDGDGHLDYALLLRSDKSEAAKLVVLLCSEDAHCRGVYNLDISGYSGEAYLRPVPRGSRVSQSEAIDTNQSATKILKFSGIRVTYFGKAEVVLYWNNKVKKIEEIQTAD